MRLAHALGLLSLLSSVGSGWASPGSEDSPADLALKEKGLTKVSNVYVLEAEKPVLAKLKDARSSFAAYASMSNQQATSQELAEMSAQLQQSRTQLQAQMSQIDQRINEQKNTPLAQTYGGFGRGSFAGAGALDPTLAAEREQIRVALAEVTMQQTTINNQTPQRKDAAALPSKIKQAEDTFKATLIELRKQVDEVKKKYSDLDADPSIKDSVKEAKKSNSKTRIGPSDAFNAGAKELEQAEKQFFGKKTSVAPKKKAKSKK